MCVLIQVHNNRLSAGCMDKCLCYSNWPAGHLKNMASIILQENTNMIAEYTSAVCPQNNHLSEKCHKHLFHIDSHLKLPSNLFRSCFIVQTQHFQCLGKLCYVLISRYVGSILFIFVLFHLGTSGELLTGKIVFERLSENPRCLAVILLV